MLVTYSIIINYIYTFTKQLTAIKKKMKTELNDLITPTVLRQIGENEFRVANNNDFTHNTQYLVSQFGLTKREHFAAMAMQGMIAIGKEATGEHIADLSVAMADELITALNKEP